MRGRVPGSSFGGALLAVVLLARGAAAQAGAASTPPIQDNSFLLEEAYNQERGVVQEISFFTRGFDSGDWLYSLTQEWPLGGQRHQLSYTLPLQRVSLPEDTATGLGDVALNYRFQLAGSGDTRLAIAPRLSVLLPTGSDERGLGAGGVAFQTNVPLSFVLGSHFVTHWNAGLTWAPSARNRAGADASTKAVNLGQSLIWLAHPRVNVMVETLWVRAQSVVDTGTTSWNEALFVSPGIRWAHNFASGLQIVPGVAVPIGLGASRGDTALILYLSLEHPFKKN